MVSGERTIQQMIVKMRHGDRSTFNNLMQALRPELRRFGAAQMQGERKDQTWQPTALVNGESARNNRARFWDWHRL